MLVVTAPFADTYGRHIFFVHYVQFMRSRFDKSNMAKQNFSQTPNVVCGGSPSRIRMVRRISFGMTMRPRSSILRTIPVAFIGYKTPLKLGFTGIVCMRTKNILRRKWQFCACTVTVQKADKKERRHGHDTFRLLDCGKPFHLPFLLRCAGRTDRCLCMHHTICCAFF